MNTWDWLIRVILAVLLMLAAYAMGLGWSALSGDSAASEALWIVPAIGRGREHPALLFPA